MQALTVANDSAGPTRGVMAAAERFGRASVEMLRTRALLRRLDTKFLLPADRVIWLLAAVTDDYLVLPSRDQLFGRYHTVYFDTPDLRCFNQHRCGRRPRHKVRIRHYLERQQAYFEIKTKQQNGLTTKVRRQRAFGDGSFGDAERKLVALHTGLPVDEMVPSVAVGFRRMTLLGKHTAERMTLDLDIQFERQGAGGALENVAILEVKQDQVSRRTPIMKALRAHGFRPTSASKYCTILGLTTPSVRINHVRPALRAVERIQN